MLPAYLHHETIKKRIRQLVENEKITKDQGEEIYLAWRKGRR